MKMIPLHTNLDTSFVNLSALIRHLRNQNFSGLINVRLSGYQAKITFDAKNSINVEEHDQIAGRIAEGDEALQRLLIRARESGGTINVFEMVEETEATETKIQPTVEKSIIKPALPSPAISASETNGNGKPAKKPISANSPVPDFLNLKPQNQAPLPLEFTNRVENRARKKKLSTEDWQTLLQLSGGLLGAVEKALNDADLNFSAIFNGARTEISGDYPFLNPSSGAFFYKHGKVEMCDQINAKLFAASINEILRAVLDRLADNPNLSEVYRDATQKILALIYRHESLYDKFAITPRLKRIVGV